MGKCLRSYRHAVSGVAHSDRANGIRRPLLALSYVLAFATLMQTPALAQNWPQRPLRVIVAFGPGGTTDVVARIIGQGLLQRLGQPVVIENRAGAGGTLGFDVVARAEKDGYTLGLMTAGQIIAAAMRRSLPYDTLTAFEPISLVAETSLVIFTRPEFPASDVRELIALAKANPGKFTFGNSGFGVTPHLAALLFCQTADINAVNVPFRSSPESIAALLGKQVDVVIETVAPVLGQVRSGELKALAVTGKDRFPALPDVPSAIESGLLPGYDVTTWYGFFAPRGTSQSIIAKLNTTINEVIADEAVRNRLTNAGAVVRGSSAEALGSHIKAELARWNKVRETAGIPQQ
jgi:tripartite-type tricarboxylate transporter receptor subunit TctC